jgi:hypothetical protein
MMAAAINCMLKFELVKRTMDGGVCVADTSGSVPNKLAYSRGLIWKSLRVVAMKHID